MSRAILENLITHRKDDTAFQLDEYIQQLKQKDKLVLPLEIELKMLKELSEFELGRSLLMNQGLNGYWITYAILHGPKLKHLPSLEHWILHSAPVFKATQERFFIFKDILQAHLKNNMTIASIPCGTMDDLIQLDTRLFKQITFVGIDYDPESIHLAKENSIHNPNASYQFIESDAWQLNIQQKFDFITSNGLNIYEKNNNKVIELYKGFYQALKSHGILLTSFLTPPPNLSPLSSWRNYSKADLIKQKAIFADIIDAQWQTFRTENETIEQLKAAGFTSTKTLYDTQGMFPTIIAYK